MSFFALFVTTLYSMEEMSCATILKNTPLMIVAHESKKYPLLHAISSNDMKATEYILKNFNNKDLIRTMTPGGNCALNTACQQIKPNLDIIQLLIDYGANPHIKATLKLHYDITIDARVLTDNCTKSKQTILQFMIDKYHLCPTHLTAKKQNLETIIKILKRAVNSPAHKKNCAFCNTHRR